MYLKAVDAVLGAVVQVLESHAFAGRHGVMMMKGLGLACSLLVCASDVNGKSQDTHKNYRGLSHEYVYQAWVDNFAKARQAGVASHQDCGGTTRLLLHAPSGHPGFRRSSPGVYGG
jgi:hypothetical protein